MRDPVLGDGVADRGGDVLLARPESCERLRAPLARQHHVAHAWRRRESTPGRRGRIRRRGGRRAGGGPLYSARCVDLACFSRLVPWPPPSSPARSGGTTTGGTGGSARAAAPPRAAPPRGGRRHHRDHRGRRPRGGRRHRRRRPARSRSTSPRPTNGGHARAAGDDAPRLLGQAPTEEEPTSTSPPRPTSAGFIYAARRHDRRVRAAGSGTPTDACCNLYGATVDDSTYLSSRHHRNRGRATPSIPSGSSSSGHSNGGFMSYRMACDHADRIAAIAASPARCRTDPSGCKPSGP